MGRNKGSYKFEKRQKELAKQKKKKEKLARKHGRVNSDRPEGDEPGAEKPRWEVVE